MLTEIGAENNTTTLVMMPSEFLTLARDLKDSLPSKNQQNSPQPWDISVDSLKKRPEEVENS